MKTYDDQCVLLQPDYGASERHTFESLDSTPISISRDTEVPSITPIDRVIIRNYFQQADFDVLLQLRRRGAGTMGGGLDTTRLLPRDLETSLSKLPRGYKRVLIGADIALIEKATSTIVDLMHDAHVMLS